eukprot:2969415-Pleurochrysis_carterae.AAC.2
MPAPKQPRKHARSFLVSSPMTDQQRRRATRIQVHRRTRFPDSNRRVTGVPRTDGNKCKNCD